MRQGSFTADHVVHACNPGIWEVEAEKSKVKATTSEHFIRNTTGMKRSLNCKTHTVQTHTGPEFRAESPCEQTCLQPEDLERTPGAWLTKPQAPGSVRCPMSPRAENNRGKHWMSFLIWLPHATHTHMYIHVHASTNIQNTMTLEEGNGQLWVTESREANHDEWQGSKEYV